MNKKLNLEDIMNESSTSKEPKPVEDMELAKTISTAQNSIDKAKPVTILSEDDNRDMESLEELDKEIEEEEAINKENEEREETSQKVKKMDEDEVFDEVLREDEIAVAEAQKKADQEAKDLTEDLLSEENLELDDDALYKKKEKERKDKEEAERSRQSYLELKQSYENTVIKKDLDDLREYRIAKAPISTSKIFNQDITSNRIGAWGLYYSGVAIAITECGGPEIQKIADETSNNDLIDQIITFQTIHKHIIDPNKGTIEEYFKKFTYLDLRDLFFALYKACFKGSNYGAYTCPNQSCKKLFMQPIKFKDMVVYPNEEVENRMRRIINQDPTSTPMIKKKLIHISPDYACTIDIPSIYKIIFEQRMISSEFRSKNQDLNNTIMYIDEIYKKNREDKMLYPIDTRPDPSNVSLTAKRKIAIYSKILMRITTDQYAFLKQQINDYIAKYAEDPNKRIKYQMPGTKCPHCGAEIEAQDMEPVTMLFIRHQLGRLLTIRQDSIS